MIKIIFEIGLIAIGGFLGAILRYLINLSLKNRIVSWGNTKIYLFTFVSNSLACFCFGLFSEMIIKDSNLSILTFTGFLGAFSTFSTLLGEFHEVKNSNLSRAYIFLIFSLVIGLGSFLVGQLIV